MNRRAAITGLSGLALAAFPISRGIAGAAATAPETIIRMWITG